MSLKCIESNCDFPLRYLRSSGAQVARCFSKPSLTPSTPDMANPNSAQVNVATRSGTNQINASVFEFLRDSDLDVGE
jgi:hypothetical protein